ncbi:hypothetical protein SEA_DEJAVU_82 [Microbacterium Phage DejaVu]|nr:hypothetical protein LUPINE_80 [Microbacterium phage Lupine]QDH92229.1 hypothetical protein SEA_PHILLYPHILLY_79 [Microbacterium phage PhillyPhilly]QDK03325.1 hypothetical protein SEA_ROMAN_83 [Microbacterium phage Roman]QIG58625.1 hypothetical protein SEA_HUBBS_80 [Microbacterium phage Hubbs]UVG34137.1 hypothetical protein SEA_PAVLO_80 [Microbacterium phage Pavlo]WNM66214.1 hypothetical protein SEA_DEJAVU_82 [Microbacterium Phage DejaVu]
MTDNRISGKARAEIKFVQGHLVKTMDKAKFIKRLKDIRRESVDPVEADLLGELIREVDSGDYDG